MTSLAKQLEKLAVPQSQVLLRADKKRASLLFDPKEAANFDKEVFYSIGVNGLEELIGVTAKFEDYQNTLFDKASQTWERSLQTKEVNEKLDELLTKFLIDLSPYFQLKASHKALEWLIYRHHIHLYNVDQILMCILPYHETNIFVRVLQLLPISDPTNQWNWLHSCATSGNSLTKQVLINHCLANPAFVSFICDMVRTYLKYHEADSRELHTVTAFFATTILGLLKQGGANSERHLAVIIPYFTELCRSRSLELRLAGYMLLAELSSRQKIAQDKLSSLLAVLSKHVVTSQRSEAVSTLCVVYQFQQVTTMSRKIYRYISRIPEILTLLSQLNQQFDISFLLIAFMEKLVQATVTEESFAQTASSSEEGNELPKVDLSSALSVIRLQDPLCSKILRMILRQLAEAGSNYIKQQVDLTSWLQYVNVLIEIFERQYPKVLDTMVSELMRETDLQEALQHMLSAGLHTRRHCLLADTGTSVWLALNHPNDDVRLLAVRELVKSISNVEDETCNEDVELLLERLEDENVSIVRTVIQCGEILLKNHKCVETLLKVLSKRAQQDVWIDVCQEAVRLLCNKQHQLLNDVLIPLLPVLSMSLSKAKLHEIILQSKPFAAHPLVKSLQKAFKSAQPADYLKCLVFGTAAYLQALSAVDVLVVIEQLEKLLYSSSVFNILLVGKLVESATGDTLFALCNCVMNMLEGIFSKSPREVTETEEDSYSIHHVSKALASGKEEEARVFSSAWTLNNLAKAFTDFPCAGSFADIGSKCVKEISRLLNFVLSRSHVAVWRPVVIHFVDGMPVEKSLQLLLTLAITNEQLSDVCQLGCYHLLQRVLIKNKITAKNIALIVPCLILSLAHPLLLVRSAAISCFVNIKSSCDVLMSSFVKKILNQRQEILADHTFINTALSLAFSSKSDFQPVLKIFLELVAVKETPGAIRQQLLTVLQDIHTEFVVDYLTKFSIAILSDMKDKEEDGRDGIECVSIILRHFNPQLAASMTIQSPTTSLLLTALSAQNSQLVLAALQQLSRKLFNALHDTEVQCKIVSALLDTGTQSQESAILHKLKKTLTRLHLKSAHISHELAGGSQLVSPMSKSSLKEKKRARSMERGKKVSRDYKRLALLLEVLQSNSEVDYAEQLFELLEKLISEEDEDVDHCAYLALTCLLNIYEHPQSPHPKGKVHVETLVHFIRNARTPQTQQVALLVVAVIAPLYPESIMHSVMSIFTFVGNTLSQQDDSYSFQVISKVIDTLLPALFKLKKSQNEVNKLIVEVMHIFADARHHIPRHRSQMLFHKLLNAVGAKERLWQLLAIIVESAVRSRSAAEDGSTETTADDSRLMQDDDLIVKKVTVVEKDVEFASLVCESFPMEIQLEAVAQIISFLNQLVDVQVTRLQQLPKTKSKIKSSDKNSVNFIDLDIMTSQQLRLLQYHTTRMLAYLVSRKSLVATVSSVMDYEHSLQKLLAQSQNYLASVARVESAQQSSSSGKFWKTLMGQVYLLLDKVAYLLPLDLFLSMAANLMGDSSISVHHKTLEFIGVKLQQLQHHKIENEQALVDMLARLVAIISQPSITEDMALTYQVALIDIKLLCRLLGKEHHGALSPAFVACTGLLQPQSIPLPVVGNALLCVAELCSCLRAHAIVHLAEFITPLMSLLRDLELLSGSSLLLNCVLCATQKLVSTLSNFLSPHMAQLVFAVCSVESIVVSSEKKATNSLASKLKELHHSIATMVTSRVLIPLLIPTLKLLGNSSQVNIMALMSLTKEHIGAMSRDDLRVHQNVLLDFFMSAFDLSYLENKLSWERAKQIEDGTVDAFLAMTIRLSENSFRPCFYKIYDWSFSEESDSFRWRQLAFCHLCDRLSDQLKSLFNLFIGHCMRMLCQVLTANNSPDGEVEYFGDDDTAVSQSCLILQYIISCLSNCLLHDSGALVTKEVFDLLLQPLINQLENFVGGDDEFEKRVHSLVVPCIAQLAVASHDDSLYKQLNYQVLLKARHQSAKVRYAALEAIENVAKKLGDEYLPLVPETIPFLAELMEDESEEVEQRCRQLVTSLETLLGESLQNYF